MSHTLHLLSAGSELHLRLPDGADPGELLALCAEAMRSNRVMGFDDFVPPGGFSPSTVVINFAHVTGVWVNNGS